MLNYGGFGKPRESLEENKQVFKGSVFGASKFGAFRMPGSPPNPMEKFNPLTQLRSSLIYVLNAVGKGSEDFERLFYRNSVPNKNMPPVEYLKAKRSSVFHKAFDSGQQAAQYVAPIHPKNANETERLLKLFTVSFLTKNLDHQQLKTLADAMFARKFKAGENIIQFGNTGTEYFVLAKGSVHVTVY